MRGLIVIVFAILGLAGCGFESSTPPLPSRPLEPQAPPPSHPVEWRHQRSDRTQLLAELDAARAYWNVNGPMKYELTISLGCYCPSSTPLVSRVAGVIVMQSTGGHWRDGRNWGPAMRTVELLFSEVRRAIHSDADEVFVEFDPRFRYPARIRIDEWREAIDDEKEWSAQLRVLQ